MQSRMDGPCSKSHCRVYRNCFSLMIGLNFEVSKLMCEWNTDTSVITFRKSLVAIARRVLTTRQPFTSSFRLVWTGHCQNVRCCISNSRIPIFAVVSLSSKKRHFCRTHWCWNNSDYRRYNNTSTASITVIAAVLLLLLLLLVLLVCGCWWLGWRVQVRSQFECFERALRWEFAVCPSTRSKTSTRCIDSSLMNRIWSEKVCLLWQLTSTSQKSSK